MQQAMVEINGIQTQVITAGRWIEEGLVPTGHTDIVIVIPGNPGLPHYYEGFLQSLKSKLPTETPVWVVGYAGLVLPPDNLCFAVPNDQPEALRYGLNGQLEHKKAFMRQYVPANARLHLVGHSIGCWIILQLLKDKEFADRVVKCYLLFPTIERMKESPSGKRLTNYILKMTTILIFLSWILSLLPVIIQRFLVLLFGIFFGISNENVKPTLQLLNPTALKRVLLLAQNEMDTVRELDDEIISKYENKLWLYYGSTDNWTPTYYFDELKTRYPNINAQICQRGFRHAFVLGHDKQVGKMMGDIINKSIV